MRWTFILFLLFISGSAIASENLMEVLSGQNATITDGVVHQITADAMDYMRWKIQVIYNNKKHLYYNDAWSYQQCLQFFDDNIGLISYEFTTPDDVDDIVYLRFGLNGSVRDTLVLFNIKDIMPNTTYTLQWRMLNNTQGEVAWTDMFLTRCGDGYSLALGEENCSRVCENKSVAGGYIPPDVTKVYEPEKCTYDPSRVICAMGYVRRGDACAELCTAGMQHIKTRGGLSFNLYSVAYSEPRLVVKYNDAMCYGVLVPDHAGSAININVDGKIYHTAN